MYSKSQIEDLETHEESLARLNKELDAKNQEILQRLVQ